MALLDRVVAVCRRLAPAGWAELLAAHGLDIRAAELGAELARDLPSVDRRLPGFEDFSPGGRRGIEPGRPAESLLLHALGSPRVVVRPDGSELADYPTLAELEAVENYVFGVSPPSLDEVRARFPGVSLAIVVFAHEYRPATDTVHRRHADLCFSRTGVARVGTLAARYGGRERGFLASATDEAPHAFPALPARYAPWLAVELDGDAGLFGPMNFDLRHQFRGVFAGRPGVEPRSDAELPFWVPLHKLFGGTECLRGLDLTVELEAGHVNEKLRRLHLQLGQNAGWSGDHLAHPPFVLREGIAELSTEPDHGSGVVTPLPHGSLIEAAEYQGEPLGFVVPPQADHGLGPTLLIPAEEGFFRHGPEYAHVRHRLETDGTVTDLNDDPEVGRRVGDGGYRALHYLDFTGDGWVQARCRALEQEVPRSVAAYSLVTAPDFYPDCEQREISEWWLGIPKPPRMVWGAPPLTLSDARLLPNIEHPDGHLSAEDGTASAIVGLPTEGTESATIPSAPLKGQPLGRHPHLPDAAASVFAPGWDVSLDRDAIGEHMAAYGLGSPFPEDAKLCAALSSYWPAVAPDAGRSFSTVWPTATPLDDEEIGTIGDMPWDGVTGPRRGDRSTVEYASFDHVDYVNEALAGQFTLAMTSRVSTAEYAARILAMARAYGALPEADPDKWRVLSFRVVEDADETLRSAEAATGVTLQGDRFAVALASALDPEPDPGDHRKVHVRIGETVNVLVGASSVVLIERDGTWQASEPS
ncbi:MAG: hypothetical protein ACR2ML_04580 [Solirubrobacteraceae bacterium]